MRDEEQATRWAVIEVLGNLLGDLGAILRFAAGKNPPDCLSEAEELDNLISQGSLVAGVPTDYDSIHPTESMD